LSAKTRPGSKSSGGAGPGKKVIVATCVLASVGVAVEFALSCRGPVLAGNEGSHVELLAAMVFRGSFVLEHDNVDVSVHNGKVYSNKPPGYAFLLAPGYFACARLVGWRISPFHFAKLASCIFSVGVAMAVVALASSLGLEGRAAILGTVGAVVGTIFPAYASLANSIPLSVLLCVLAVLFRRLHAVRGGGWRWSVSAFAAAWSVITDYSNGFFLLPLVAVLVLDVVRRPGLVVWGLPSLVPLALLGWYNWRCFGSPLVLTYSFYRAPPIIPWDGVSGSLALSNIPGGLYGLVLSASRGMFVVSPVTVLGAVACWWVFRERLGGARLVALCAASGLVLNGAYSLWHGGHCVGYRHALQSGVFLGLLSGFFFARAGRWASRRRLLPRGARAVAMAVLMVSCLSGVASFMIHLDPRLVDLTWTPGAVEAHAAYWGELVPRLVASYLP